MSFRIKPQASQLLSVADTGVQLAPLFDNTTYWPASRTATLTIAVDPTATGYCCITNGESNSARILNPGDVKTYGPFDRDTFATMWLFAPVNAVGNELSVAVSLDEILSEN
jgi:hypothetical protein